MISAGARALRGLLGEGVEPDCAAWLLAAIAIGYGAGWLAWTRRLWWKVNDPLREESPEPAP